MLFISVLLRVLYRRPCQNVILDHHVFQLKSCKKIILKIIFISKCSNSSYPVIPSVKIFKHFFEVVSQKMRIWLWNFVFIKQLTSTNIHVDALKYIMKTCDSTWLWSLTTIIFMLKKNFSQFMVLVHF